MQSKKAQELSVTVIVVAAVALIVLVVLVAIFTGKIGKFRESIGNQETNSCAGNCKARSFEGSLIKTTACDSTAKEIEISGFFVDVPEGQKCCCKTK